ncbi:MAG: hypothetical protein GF419_14085 [Ignavibacteriales bacterium]|nr:hypothetical protein [Ignavibacteriales bacterium]
MLRTLLALTPVWALVGTYVVSDPYEVIHPDYDSNEPRADYNKEFISFSYHSVDKYLHHRVSYDYDAFMLGNSKVMGFDLDYWKDICDVSPYLLWGTGEPLYNIVEKLIFLDTSNASLSNVIILLDDRALAPYHYKFQESFNFISCLHPRISQRSAIEYQWMFFKRFMLEGDYSKYLSYVVPAVILRTDEKSLKRSELYVDPITNGLTMRIFNDTVDQSSLGDIGPLDPANRQEYFTKRIRWSQLVLLWKIRGALVRNNSDYKILIPPVLNKKKLHFEDDRKLRHIFGEERVFNFSGNNGITRSPDLFFDPIHFRPHVGAMIMDSIYGGRDDVFDTAQ